MIADIFMSIYSRADIVLHTFIDALFFWSNDNYVLLNPVKCASVTFSLSKTIHENFYTVNVLNYFIFKE